MIRFSFVLATTFIVILFCHESLAILKIFRLKNKIRKNPLIGVKQIDNIYSYKEDGYAISYRIKESIAGIKTVEWQFLKRRLTFFEEKILNIKKSLNKFFLYHRWSILFHPLVIIIIIVSVTIFYFGIKEHSLKRIERFRWILSMVTGISAESIEYAGGGNFKISGQKHSVDREIEPVSVMFNPLKYLFFSDTAKVSYYNEKLDTYVNYPVNVGDKGDVWLEKEDGPIHGKVLSNEIVWDDPQRVGMRSEVSGHRFIVEDGKIKIIDE